MYQLKKYLDSLSTKEQETFAGACGTTVGYLRKSLSISTKKYDGKCILGSRIVRLMDKNSGGKISMVELQPEVFEGLIEIKSLPETVQREIAGAK